MQTSKAKYTQLFWDVDDTLVNFKASERLSLRACFSRFGIALSDQDIEVYAEINHGYWALLEQGRIKKTALVRDRFSDFFHYLGVTGVDPGEMNRLFQLELAETSVLNDEGLALCTELNAHCRQFVVTNGSAVAQKGKLRNTGLDRLMEAVFISEELGFEKPDLRFFESCFGQIPGFDNANSVIIGDSLTSDMQGGKNAGLCCCWYNPRSLPAPEGLALDYIIKDLRDLKEILFGTN